MNRNLGLKDILIISQNNERDCIAKEVDSPSYCPHCNSDSFVLFGYKKLNIKHIFEDLPYSILVNRQRYRCKSCSHTFTLDISLLTDIDISHRMTISCVNYLRKKSTTMSQRQLAERYNISKTVIQKILK